MAEVSLRAEGGGTTTMVCGDSRFGANVSF